MTTGKRCFERCCFVGARVSARYAYDAEAASLGYGGYQRGPRPGIESL